MKNLDDKFKEPQYVGRPNIGNSEHLFGRLKQILDNRWLTNNGPLVIEFEKKICELTSAHHCIATANGTLALELAIRAVGMQGEVLVPTFTFVATAHALAWQSIKPVFVDCEPHTTSMDLAHAQTMINEHTTGIIGVHIWGNCRQTDDLLKFAQHNNLKIIFDAAHAFACTHRGQKISDQGDASIFSFHATKFLNSFEGGAICTTDSDLSQRLRRMRNFGFAGEDDVEEMGTNAKMTEICAAMGLVNFESIDSFIDHNRNNYYCYRDLLKTIHGVDLIPYNETENNNYQYIIVVVDESIAGIDRKGLKKALLDYNVHARRYFYPGIHRMKAYSPQAPLPNAEDFSNRVLALPTGTSIGHAEICQIVRIIDKIVCQSNFTNECDQPSVRLTTN